MGKQGEDGEMGRWGDGEAEEREAYKNQTIIYLFWLYEKKALTLPAY